MTKPRPKTGEARKTKLPLKIDRLPQSAQDAIQALYGRGRTWVEIAEQSSRPYSAEWEKDGGGFIDWPNVDPDALDLFPGLRLAKSSLQRWFDLRVSQVRAQVMAESAKAREWAAAFAGNDLAGSNAAVMNAMRDFHRPRMLPSRSSKWLRVCANRRRNSAASGTISSAAALGVGARRSATKSAIVKSVS